MAGTVILPWYATGFRADAFQQALNRVAAVALRYGATSYAVYRARDDRYKFLQPGVDDGRARVVDHVRDLVSERHRDAGDHARERTGDVIEGVVIVVADDHLPRAPKARPRSPRARQLDLLAHALKHNGRWATVQLTHERRSFRAFERARQAVDDAHVLGPRRRQGLQRALAAQPRQGPDGAFGGLRPSHADRLRLRPRARARRGGQGRGAHLSSRRHGDAARGDPPGGDEHLDDDQRHR